MVGFVVRVFGVGMVGVGVFFWDVWFVNLIWICMVFFIKLYKFVKLGVCFVVVGVLCFVGVNFFLV